MSKKIIVVGGGPAGMMAALTAKEQNKENEVILMERNQNLGRKLLLTGNGRCNISNEDITIFNYNPDETGILEDVLNDFSVNQLKKFLLRSGLMTYEVNGGIYPYSNQSKSVLDILIIRLRYSGVKILCNAFLKDVEKTERGYHVTYMLGDSNHSETESEEDCDSLILACGGKAAPSTGSDGNAFKFARKMGLEVSNTYPVLVQLKSDFNHNKELSGVRCHAGVQGILHKENNMEETTAYFGELQITDYGLSGIVIFNLSRELSKPLEEGIKCDVLINFLPDMSFDLFDSLITERRELCVGLSVREFLSGLLNEKLLNYLLEREGIAPDAEIRSLTDERILDIIQSFQEVLIPVSGHNGYNNAQATKGGVLLSNLTHDLEALQAPGLYFAGEMLDVDGECGGYNLHWAFASGYRAGKSAGTSRGEGVIS